MSCSSQADNQRSPSAEKEATRADWAHIFLAVLPVLPLGTSTTPSDSAKIAAALRAAAAAAMARHGAELRRTAVAQWEIRLRVGDNSGAWRLVVSLPTGQTHSSCTHHQHADQCQTCCNHHRTLRETIRQSCMSFLQCWRNIDIEPKCWRCTWLTCLFCDPEKGVITGAPLSMHAMCSFQAPGNIAC